MTACLHGFCFQQSITAAFVLVRASVLSMCIEYICSCEAVYRSWEVLGAINGGCIHDMGLHTCIVYNHVYIDPLVKF